MAAEDDLPGPLSELVARLESSGFERRADKLDRESFGNRLLELVEGPRELRLVLDRGDWSAQLRVAGDWLDSELVLAALDGSDAPIQALTDDELAAATLEALERLPQDEAASELLRQTAEETAERRAPRLFGD
jgi:hypothetical protein